VAACAVVAWLPDTPLVPTHGGRAHGQGELGVLFVALLAAAFACYLGGLWAVRRGARFTVVFALACAIQLAPLAAPLLISSDAWTYWSYARLHDPYRQTPSDDPVSAAHAGAAYLHTTSVYGPAFSLISKPTALVRSPGVAAWIFKSAAALCVLAATWLVARRRPYAAALVGWNPVVAVHFGARWAQRRVDDRADRRRVGARRGRPRAGGRRGVVARRADQVGAARRPAVACARGPCDWQARRPRRLWH